MLVHSLYWCLLKNRSQDDNVLHTPQTYQLHILHIL